MLNLYEFRILKGFAKAQFRNRRYFVKTQQPKQMLFCQTTTADVNLSIFSTKIWQVKRIGYAFLALSQEQDIILKLFLVGNRVRLLGS